MEIRTTLSSRKPTSRCMDERQHPAPCLTSCSRRTWLWRIGALAALSACSSDAAIVAPDPAAVQLQDGVLTVRLNLLGALQSPGSAYVFSEQRVIVIRVGVRDYRAFTNICTHAGCGISLFQSERMICQCHGSEYDVDGINVAGPAPLPLVRYPSTIDAAGVTLRIDIRG